MRQNFRPIAERKPCAIVELYHHARLNGQSGAGAENLNSVVDQIRTAGSGKSEIGINILPSVDKIVGAVSRFGRAVNIFVSGVLTVDYHGVVCQPIGRTRSGGICVVSLH